MYDIIKCQLDPGVSRTHHRCHAMCSFSRAGEVIASRSDFNMNLGQLHSTGVILLDMSHLSLLEHSMASKPASTPAVPSKQAAVVWRDFVTDVLRHIISASTLTILVPVTPLCLPDLLL